jgi:ubiquinone/menaquinone biosynthesis C-methylase UbiE
MFGRRTKYDSKAESDFFSKGEYDLDRQDACGAMIVADVVDNTIATLSLWGLAPPLRVAEFGGGPGMYSFALSRRLEGIHFVNIDITESPLRYALSYAQEKGHDQYSCINADIRQTPLKDGSVDVVLYFGVLHHFPDIESLFAVLSEGHRICRKGIMIYEPSGDNVLHGISRRVADTLKFFHAEVAVTVNETIHSSRTYRKVLTKTGFEDINMVFQDRFFKDKGLCGLYKRSIMSADASPLIRRLVLIRAHIFRLWALLLPGSRLSSNNVFIYAQKKQS